MVLQLIGKVQILYSVLTAPKLFLLIHARQCYFLEGSEQTCGWRLQILSNSMMLSIHLFIYLSIYLFTYFLWYCGLNSVSHACLASALPLESCPQDFLLIVIFK
jgi:hypothetical protein